MGYVIEYVDGKPKITTIGWMGLVVLLLLAGIFIINIIQTIVAIWVDIRL
jgi:hypothetical protein